MRILFVVKDNLSHEPLGIEYLSAALKAVGHETKACQESELFDHVESWNPDFVAFSVITGDEDRWGKLAEELKGRFFNVKTIFGGPHFLFFSKDRQRGADIVIRGEAEQSVVSAVRNNQWINFEIIHDLDRLNPPDRSVFYHNGFPLVKSNPIRNFLTCRGCVYACSYCYNSNEEWNRMVGNKSRLRYHSPEYVVEDVRRVFKDYGGGLASFQDDVFGIDMQWLEKFSRLYRSTGIPFFAQLRPALITRDRIQLLKEAGLHILSFAIESGIEKTRRTILGRKESNEMIFKVCEMLHSEGVRFRMQNLIGLPVEDSLWDAVETLRFNICCKPTLSWCALLQAYPGTKIAEYVVKIGMTTMDELKKNVEATFFDIPSLPVRNAAQIGRLHKWWSAVVRWPWLFWVVTRILININLGKRIHAWIFDQTKQYINRREYWQVKNRREIKE